MKRWLKRIFYTPRHSKPTDENILRLLMPSAVGIALCMVCLAGSTWAWFSASVQTVAQNLTYYNPTVCDMGGRLVVCENGGDISGVNMRVMSMSYDGTSQVTYPLG